MVFPIIVTIISALIPLIGLMLQNKFLVFIGSVFFLFIIGAFSGALFVNIPGYIWIALAIGLTLLLVKGK